MFKTVILMVLLSITIGCLQTHGEISIQKLTTDKESYYSNETMLVSLEIFSENDINNVRVNVSGIENSFGRSMIEEGRIIDLKKGNNTVEFVFKTPSCEECSALSPGQYMINASVENENGILRNISKPVNLEREQDQK